MSGPNTDYDPVEVTPLKADQVEAALRRTACQLSDVGSHDHPDYRAEQAFLRVLRQPGVGLDHHARAFLALVTALRYDAADPAVVARASQLGEPFIAAAVRQVVPPAGPIRSASATSSSSPVAWP